MNLNYLVQCKREIEDNELGYTDERVYKPAKKLYEDIF